MEININPKRVANLLKQMINDICVENFVWFEDVNKEEGASVWDMIEAIDLLDDAEEKNINIHIRDDEETQAWED